MSFAKERPKSAGPLRRNSPLLTIRQLVPSEISSLTASFVPNTKPELCQHQNPTPMTEKKRKALLNLQKREEIRATRNRLKGVLIQKLVNKYGE
jgi:hypothetical protein